MRLSLCLGVLLLGTWLLWSGPFSIDHSLVLYCGIGSCVLVVLISLRMRIVDREAIPIHLLPRFVVYVPWLIKQIVLANIDVARRILHPKLPITPTVVVLETTQKTDVCRVIYANSITLTPGTVSIEAEGGKITVHSISKEGAEDLEGGEMDRRVTWVEGSP